MGFLKTLFGSSGQVVCTCKQCGTEYRLGENTAVTTPEVMRKVMGSQWTIDWDLLAINTTRCSREDEDIKIVEAAQQAKEKGRGKCGKCETVHKYRWS